MRPWICMLALGAGLTAASALPAAANNLTPQASNGAAKGHVGRPFLRHGFFHHRPFLGPFAFGSPIFFPSPFWDDDSMPSGVAATAPPIVLMTAPPPESPRRTAVEERASVETTSDGVVIVRGPGSRHLSY